tara:strand:- start:778 stop:894 length:117 start_codon:yes stop_codon:yes gene_type:complete
VIDKLADVSNEDLDKSINQCLDNPKQAIIDNPKQAGLV